MIQHLKRLIILIAVIAHAFVAVLFLISAFSSYISPEKASLSVILGLLYPMFLFLNIGFLIGWIFLRRWYLLISLFSLLIGWSSIRLYVPLHCSEVVIADNEKSIDILTYNVFMFGNLKAHLPDNENPILAYVQEIDPDIVCFQEYMLSENPKFLTAKQIDQALKQYPYRNRSSNTACYSKYPIVGSRPIKYDTDGGNSSTLYKIDVEGDTIYLINNHLESNRFTDNDKEIYRNMIKNVEPNLWEEMKNKLIHKMIKSTRIRARQAEAITETITGLHSDKVIVCGDFNDTPMSYVYRTIKGDMDDAYAARGFGPGITYHENGFWFRIDHILYGKDFTAVDSKIDRVKYSDHYPLRATLKWNKKEK